MTYKFDSDRVMVKKINKESDASASDMDPHHTPGFHSLQSTGRHCEAIHRTDNGCELMRPTCIAIYTHTVKYQKISNILRRV
jgi:hypothetical protein